MLIVILLITWVKTQLKNRLLGMHVLATRRREGRKAILHLSGSVCKHTLSQAQMAAAQRDL